MEPAPHPFLTIDYDTARELIFVATPEGTPTPTPVAEGGPARRLRDAMEPITYHPIWSRRTNDVLEKLGLKIFTGYVYGKAAVLGDAPTEVVVSAFAPYEPRLIAAAYEEARRQCGRAGMLAAREEATVESLAEVLEGEEVTAAVAALRRGVEAADGTGRPIFSGLRALGWPDHPAGQLWRACDLLREHRGDGHVAACISAGLGRGAPGMVRVRRRRRRRRARRARPGYRRAAHRHRSASPRRHRGTHRRHAAARHRCHRG
jgi:helix-turn-helix protein